MNVATVDGKIYAIGGRGADGKTVTTNEVYDPAKNSWRVLAPKVRRIAAS